MKRIKFVRRSSWRYLLLLGVGILSCLLGVMMYGIELNLFIFVGFGCMALFLIRPFLYKRYLGWNKNSLQLKFSYWGMKVIPFNSIKGISIEANTLIITLHTGRSVQYNVQDIAPEDIHKLQRIVIRHSNLSS